ncbi:hypothetical protein C7974DRAFT_389260 [Boeremia exigua]|uniref:uncharacterized protein n=1 Tax=Boeremia exigua TaxID=749465 RepID=UPI001E8DCC47|nr:uncharacterized protein C7974DRAFT_389260 [Boeremia exigua]KAH6639822.1 hypothetical protein C7974DRAFT_389260 [Boeremia exigua]
MTANVTASQACDEQSSDTVPGTVASDNHELGQTLPRTPRQSVLQALNSGEVPEDPVARFEYYDALTNLFSIRFLRDGTNCEEVMVYSDLAKANIPRGFEGSIFSNVDDNTFGDAYVFYRLLAWDMEKTPQNARRLIDAIGWKYEIAPAVITLQETGSYALAKFEIYKERKDDESLQDAIQNCEDFLGEMREELRDTQEVDSISDPNQVAEYRELFGSVSASLSQLLYHQFRQSKQKDVLERCIKLGADAYPDVPGAERLELEISLNDAAIAYSFNHIAFDGPRSNHNVPRWSDISDEPTASTVPNMNTDQSDPDVGLYDKLQLASDNSQIRIVQLQCGQYGSPVVCMLEVVDLANCPAYDALSYVWGDPNCTDFISLQGRTHQVTTNLYDALARLRLPEKHRRIWIDALCINQKDVKEKEGQIGLMDKIYTNANEVCMWLGEPARIQAFSDDPREIPCHEEAAKMLEAMLPETYPQIRPHLSVLADRDFKVVSNASLMDLASILYQLPFCIRPIPSAPDKSVLNGLAPDRVESGFSTDIAALLEVTSNMNIVKDFGEVQKRNSWCQDVTTETPECYNWDDELRISEYLEAKMTGSDWPIVGAFILIILFGMDVHFHDLPFFGSAGASSVVGITAQAWNKSCYALYHLLSNKYWTRAWILQELVLARVPKIYFGKHTLPYHQLVQAMVNFNRHYSTCCKDVVPAGGTAACSSPSWWTRLHSTFTNFIESPSEMWFARRLKESDSEDPNSSITTVLLSNLKKRQATEARDMVFSTLGMIDNEGPDRIPVDYAAPVERIYAQATSRALLESKKDSLFVFAGYGRSEELKHKLPSWCIDFTAPLEWSGLFPEISPLFDAFPGSEGDTRMETDLCFSVTSAKVDVIVRVSSFSQSCDHSEWSDIIHNVDRWKECASLPSDTEDATATDRERSFWRTVLGGCLPALGSALQSSPFSYERLSDADFALISRWQTWLHDPNRALDPSIFEGDYQNAYRVDWLQQAEGFARLNRRLHHAMMYRRLFVSEKGRFGSGAGNNDSEHFTRVEVGDEVHVIKGFRLPIVLRPIVSVKRGGLQYGNDPTAFSADLESCVHDEDVVYQLVGPCFIDGLMDGEATEAEGFSTKRIHLR